MSEIFMKQGGINSLTSMTQERLMEKSSAARSEKSASGAKSFSETLVSMLEDVNEMQKDADSATQDFAKGKGSLHGVMIAVEKADISLRALNSVRGKLIEAYQEVMRMPV